MITHTPLVVVSLPIKTLVVRQQPTDSDAHHKCYSYYNMPMSALVQVAAINGALVQVAAIISALVQLGCYH